MAVLLSMSAAARIPKMSGGYKDVIAIPVDDPQTKAIAGALLEPAGAGPFPVVIYMGTCASIGSGEEHYVQTALGERLLSRGFAMLIVDPYSPLSMAPRFSSKVAPQNSPVWRVGDQPWA